MPTEPKTMPRLCASFALLVACGAMLAADDLARHYGFQPLEVVKVDPKAGPLVAADMNGDGLEDLVVVDNFKNRIDINFQKKGAKATDDVPPARGDEDHVVTTRMQLVGVGHFLSKPSTPESGSCVALELGEQHALDLADARDRRESMGRMQVPVEERRCLLRDGQHDRAGTVCPLVSTGPALFEHIHRWRIVSPSDHQPVGPFCKARVLPCNEHREPQARWARTDDGHASTLALTDARCESLCFASP